MDEDDTWIQLAAATANVVRWLVKEQKPCSEARNERGADTEIEQHHKAERGKVFIK